MVLPVSGVKRQVAAAPPKPAWQTTGSYKPNYTTYSSPFGGPGWNTKPASLDAATIADQQDRTAAAASDVAAARARKADSQELEAARQVAAFHQYGRENNASYGGQMADFGSAGTGRSAGAQGVTANALAQSLADERAAYAQSRADRVYAVQQVLDEAKRRQSLVTDSVNRQTALIGSDPARLIRSVTQ